MSAYILDVTEKEFKLLETVEGSDGSVNTSGIEFILQKARGWAMACKSGTYIAW